MTSKGFLSLPNELLCEVASHLHGDRLSLLALSNVNRALNANTEKYLYGEACNLSPKQQRLFRRTLSEHPHLRQVIQSYGPVDVEQHAVDFHAIVPKDQFALLSSFPNLKRLRLNLGESWCSPNRVPSDKDMNFDVTKLNKVSHIEVIDAYKCEDNIALPTQFLHSLMRRPTIRTFEIKNIAHAVRDRRRLTDPWDFHRGPTSNITTLRLLGRQKQKNDRLSKRCEAEDLAVLLDGCTSLKSLNCTDIFVEYGPPYTFIWRLHITAALEIVAATLEELTLTLTNVNRHDVRRRGESVDLSRFPVLKNLCVAASFIMHCQFTQRSKSQLFTRLPASLEHLQIDFDNSLSGFHPDAETFTPFAYQWLLQFPDRKKESFPNLKTVKLVEPGPEGAEDAMRRWKVPETLRKRLGEEGIEMEILLRGE